MASHANSTAAGSAPQGRGRDNYEPVAGESQAAWTYPHWRPGGDGAKPNASTDTEFALSFDQQRKARLLVLPALFDEANKMRRFTVELMRRLDLAGIDSFLPDLPGWNESRASLSEQTLESWQAAARAVADHFGATHVLTIRAAALLAPAGLPGWRYASTGGRQMLRSMLRARTISAREAGRDETTAELQELGRNEGLTLGGWQIGPAMFAALEDAGTPAPGELTDISQSALGGSGLWLRAEPDEAPEQTDALTGLIAVELNESGALGSDSKTAPEHTKGATASAVGPRQLLTFAWKGTALGGTLDCGSSATGLLYVSGGNEVRAGAFNGQAAMAAKIAAAGYPVFRFDRRGIGDSDGENAGFRGEADDIAAALAAFRAAAPHVTRIIGFGNCDAASALMLSGGAGLDGLILSNPWTIEDADDDTPPPEAVRARYLEKLKNPREIWRLLSGGVDLKKLAKGLGQASKGSVAPSSLAEEMAAGIADYPGEVDILLANSDRTAQMFASSWDKADSRIRRCEGASHAYVEPESFAWLESEIIEVLRAADE